MDITTDMLIDMALNVVGFLAAGALSMVIYSVFAQRRKVSTESDLSSDITKEPSLQLEHKTIRSEPIGEFVPLSCAAATDTNGTYQANDRRLHRAEIVRIAKAMLKAGTANSEIKSVLPVSDAELALLGYEQT